MDKQVLKKFTKLQNKVCGMLNRLQAENKIDGDQVRKYLDDVLFNPILTYNELQKIEMEIKCY